MAKKSKEVSVASAVAPVSLTLTRTPANQVAFRVVRGDNGEEVSVPVKRVRRQRADSRSAFLSVTFPAGTSREDAEAEAKNFGLDGYDITETDSGELVLRRSDTAEADAPTIRVSLGNGRFVTMLRTDTGEATRPDSGLKLISISLDKEVFRSDDQVQEYLSQKAIDIAEWGAENTDTHYVFTRSSEGSVGSAGKIELEDGVTVTVTRSEENDVPASIASVVSEAAYGSWGWGQLDFAAALADVEFCNLTESAIYKFRDVVDNIMFYSYLPLAARKELIYRASAQFALYMGNLLDGLPAGVVLVQRSSNTKKESEMTDKTQQDQQSTETAANSNTNTEQLTRADVQEMITLAVTAALAAGKNDAPAQKAEDTVTRNDDAADAAQKATLSALETLTRSVEELTKSVSGVQTKVTDMAATTVVRSDSPDVSTSGESKKRDVFAGVLGRA